MSDSNCIFCKIIAGEIPSHKLYENEHVFAFLDISPLSLGHFLVIPKIHTEKFHELDNQSACEIILTLKKLALALGIQDYNILQNNGKIAHQAVFHVHFHLIPKLSTKKGLGIIWNQISLKDQEFKEIKEKVISKL